MIRNRKTRWAPHAEHKTTLIMRRYIQTLCNRSGKGKQLKTAGSVCKVCGKTLNASLRTVSRQHNNTTETDRAKDGRFEHTKSVSTLELLTVTERGFRQWDLTASGKTAPKCQQI